jgi:hypothetical protein
MPYSNWEKQKAYEREWKRWKGIGIKAGTFKSRSTVYESWSEESQMTIDELLDETLGLIKEDLGRIKTDMEKAPTSAGAWANTLVKYAQALVLLRGDQIYAKQAEKDKISKMTPQQVEDEMRKALNEVKQMPNKGKK